LNNFLIQTEKLCKGFRVDGLEAPVLFDIDLEVGRGEFAAVMGPSGCGKSTLMHILGLMLTPSSGRVILDGQDTSSFTDRERSRFRRDKIGFVFQRFNLLHTLTAYDNLAAAERIRGRALDGQIDRALAAVQMEGKKQHKPGQLSIGQQQRVAIARAICHEPELILADEPTGNLDSANTESILNLFRQIHRERKVTIVMITHSITAAQWAERIVYMADGRIENR